MLIGKEIYLAFNCLTIKETKDKISNYHTSMMPLISEDWAGEKPTMSDHCFSTVSPLGRATYTNNFYGGL